MGDGSPIFDPLSSGREKRNFKKEIILKEFFLNPLTKTSSNEHIHFFYKQPHFRVEPRVAIKIIKMRLKVAMKLLSIFGIEAQGC